MRIQTTTCDRCSCNMGEDDPYMFNLLSPAGTVYRRIDLCRDCYLTLKQWLEPDAHQVISEAHKATDKKAKGHQNV